MKLPEKNYCLKLLKKHNPENIVNHSLKVTEVAVFLAKKIKKTGHDIDIKLIELGAILHDIDKAGQIKHGFEFNEQEEKLRQLGFIELTEIIRKHHLSALLENNYSLEEKIVYYADKRVNHDKIVLLKERFNYMLKRYNEKKELILKTKPLVEKIEKELLEMAGLQEKDLLNIN